MLPLRTDLVTKKDAPVETGAVNMRKFCFAFGDKITRVVSTNGYASVINR